MLCEIGGTVGDIEGLPFFEAIRQIGNELGRDLVKYVHLTLLPYIATSQELKTKPTQHSVKELRSIGVQPDILVCRSYKEISDEVKDKIALFCNVRRENVIAALDVKNIYEVPIRYHEEKLDEMLIKEFNIHDSKEPDLTKWHDIVHKIKTAQYEINIAIVGKYKSQDSYMSLIEAINHAAITKNSKVNIKWINARVLNNDNISQKFEGVHAIIVPGGFGGEGVDGKIIAIKYAREQKIPFFGICLGMQLAVIEYARNVCGLVDASSTEFGDTKHPIIGLLTEWENKDVKETRSVKSDLGGTMRLGAYDCKLIRGTKTAAIYSDADIISERHRHRYEFNNEYLKILEAKGLDASGTSPDGSLVEIIELKDHPWFVATQFHPEFKSKLFEPHPLFCSLIEAALKFAKYD